jgi:hypothetical protein
MGGHDDRKNMDSFSPDPFPPLPQAPKTLRELETQLLQSIERLDRGEGVDGEESFRRLRERIKKFGDNA